ncbi:hypothetical protein [Mucilaginibacter sp.]|uniref:hypothetical protein n=1 Tax=Mucilaginibacter sp. TaxID=1882438 RepID=UPI003267DD30
MKKFKKIMRLCGLVLFLLLAVGGVSLTGAAPTRPQNRDSFLTEQIEDEREETDEPLNENFY